MPAGRDVTAETSLSLGNPPTGSGPLVGHGVGPETPPSGLITQRSRVQILPPLPEKVQDTGPVRFAGRGLGLPAGPRASRRGRRVAQQQRSRRLGRGRCRCMPMARYVACARANVVPTAAPLNQAQLGWAK